MKYQFLPLDEDDIVECSHLYVNTFKHEPWNEDWDVDDAFGSLIIMGKSIEAVSKRLNSDRAMCAGF